MTTPFPPDQIEKVGNNSTPSPTYTTTYCSFGLMVLHYSSRLGSRVVHVPRLPVEETKHARRRQSKVAVIKYSGVTQNGMINTFIHQGGSIHTPREGKSTYLDMVNALRNIQG